MISQRLRKNSARWKRNKAIQRLSKSSKNLMRDNTLKYLKYKTFTMSASNASLQLGSSELVVLRRTCRMQWGKFIELSTHGSKRSTTQMRRFARFVIYFINLPIFQLYIIKMSWIWAGVGCSENPTNFL